LRILRARKLRKPESNMHLGDESSSDRNGAFELSTG
jgi:hypothetical protein